MRQDRQRKSMEQAILAEGLLRQRKREQNAEKQRLWRERHGQRYIRNWRKLNGWRIQSQKFKSLSPDALLDNVCLSLDANPLLERYIANKPLQPDQIIMQKESYDPNY